MFGEYKRLNSRVGMSKRSAKKSTSEKKSQHPSATKGKLVEEIVQKMHDSPNVKVERRVFLDSVGGSGKREIDILLTSSVAGYPVRLAIECKNEKTPIGSPKIDAFVGKLQDVGIPSQLGIYVSASGYTGGAIERARKAGIKTLVLTGLTRIVYRRPLLRLSNLLLTSSPRSRSSRYRTSYPQ